MSFYFAGIDTTGHLVAFALYCLGEYPKYKERIVEEIKKEIHDLNGITYENLQVHLLLFRNWNLWDFS